MSECKLCRGRGMVEMPHGNCENGFWENCPMCHLEAEHQLGPSCGSVVFAFAMFVLFLPFYPLFWVMYRLEAKPCPNCGERWFTELVGEWGGEDWKCSRCEVHWHVPYKK